MKFRYDKEDDVLMVWLSQAKVDYAEKNKNVIIHFSKNDKPILMEILEASKFLKNTSKVLPDSIKKQFVTA
ncbi:hypothetical protein A2803_05000 [Candidatus Woesebacteria bacterium RIFCSPHIGHO2_01_FULL_44_21]|uniref:DUF2283 domain-containing protein n=1 Tax=Candidatus Woesebacteria bacterium RIFCSPHIGHO2_01_FULL_44_21 TaxID=1802503 RepID=A0A1F7Z007_9BACT|nr:MAG: hypothetical protein A2803_05000 [Candidatus Woesebacteria bacterium RIFCSPHIGHO2_01_FULL_44_21]OGM68907.1 MAG: hypothetical protein A2897_01975 [Candidatus Woesebacteria bacterium RIFCSPLOWO2_01_FULL_44_24b]